MNTENLIIKQPFDPAPYAERIERLLGQMTVAEKVGQLNMDHISEGATDCNLGDRASMDAEERKVRGGQVGSLLMRGRKAANHFQRIAVEESRLGIPLLFGFDVIHGHKTVFPIPLGSASTWDPKMLREAENYAAREAYEDGINWILTPMIDLCRDPRWGRVAEGAGEDPLLGSLIAQAKVMGLQVVNPETGYPYTAACLKHYCGYGLSQGGRDYEECETSPRTLFMDYMKPYHAAVDAGSMTAMSAFSVLNGEPVTGSRYYLTEVLRNRYGFRGFVVSDYDAVRELIHHRVAADGKEAAGMALLAGVDQDMCSHAFEEHCGALYEEDARFAEAVDEAVRRILGVKFAMGLFEHPYFPEEGKEAYSPMPGIREAARNVGRHSIVLLKNEKGTLPLSASKKYFLTGPMSDNVGDMGGAWANYWPDTDVITVRRGLEDAGLRILHSEGCPFTGKYCFDSRDKSGFAEALEVARTCDEIIYVCGEKAAWSGENRGRVSLDLPWLQTEYLRELKKTGKKIISVLMCGRAMSCPELAEKSDALVLAWHLGTEAGHAVADVLTGAHSPSGRLPITFPYYTGQTPNYHSILSSGRERENLIRYKDGENRPLYPFGYGLSYADIAYDRIRVSRNRCRADETIRVEVDLANRSDRDAFEVVQVYFQDVVSSLPTPERKLCGFAKALVPAGTSVTVQVAVPVERLSLMTLDLREVVEPGEFLLFVGRDSTCSETVKIVVE